MYGLESQDVFTDVCLSTDLKTQKGWGLGGGAAWTVIRVCAVYNVELRGHVLQKCLFCNMMEP